MLNRLGLMTVMLIVGACALLSMGETPSQPKIRVACIGDSITFGTGVQDREKNAYPAVLQQLLGDRYEVRNFGDPGRGVILSSMRGKEPRAFFKRPGHVEALAFKPDIVICNLGINDDVAWAQGKRDEFINDYLTLLDSYQALETNPQIFIWTKLAPLLKGHRSHNSATTPVAFRMRTDLELVAEYGRVIGLDMFNPLIGVDNVMTSDGIHPNANGARLIAESTFRQIQPFLDIPKDRLEFPWHIASGMVIQKGKPFVLSGLCAPNTTVIATIDSRNCVQETSDAYGRFSLSSYHPLEPGMAHTIHIATAGASKTLIDILVGDVWLAVGQSNMEWTLDKAQGGKNAFSSLDSEAKNNIRILNRSRIMHTYGGGWDLTKLPSVEKPQDWLHGEWLTMSEATPQQLPAVPFYFAREMTKANHVPVGVITVAVGGIPAESLISERTMLGDPQLVKNFVNGPWFDNPNSTLPEWPLKRAKENLSKYLAQKEKNEPLPFHYFQPSVVHNAGILPLKDVAFSGVIYYQGESNATTGGKPDLATPDALNERVYTAVIRDYRNFFQDTALPFVMVELPKMNRPWESFRSVQRKVCAAEGALLCDIFDLGNPNDVHPTNKEDVGKRLASLVLQPKSIVITPSTPALIPMPKKVEWTGKTVFMDSGTILSVSAHDMMNGTPWLENVKREIPKFNTPLNFTKVFGVLLWKDTYPSCGEEGYKLVVNDSGCTITARTERGLYWGVQTFKQLITPATDTQPAQIALCTIVDEPAFPVRGFMNDVGRNYLGVDKIKRIMDVMASYKLNTYHFHCTDNHGWRLESKLYPQLQADSAFTRKPGKFYTQKEFVELVEYARLRGITVIPEFDLPGHTEAFRKALGVKGMEDPRAVKIVVDLINELCSLVPAEKMPYIHIGGDEAHGAAEKVSAATLATWFEAVKANGRRAVAWCPGENVQKFNPIRQTWTGRRNRPPKGSDYFDSQENYVNHFDPFEAVSTLFFRKNCPFPDANGLGGILCSWPDLYIDDDQNHLLQTPIFQSIVTYAESLWRNSRVDRTDFYTNLPPQGHSELTAFREFENRLVAHHDRYFRDLPFTYVRQSDIPWKIIGPFPNGGKTATVFEVENAWKEMYAVDGKEYRWQSEIRTGATIIYKHYCDYPTFANPNWKFETPNSTYYAATAIWSPKEQTVPCWIGAQFFATSDFRGDPANVPGKWSNADAEFFVNGEKLPAPKWKTPNKRNSRDALSPMMEDENYHFRAPTPVTLKKGWNKVLVKSPCTRPHRWMFTFVPVWWEGEKMGVGVREFPGLKFAVEPLSE